MTAPFKILGIAPYEELNTSMNIVSKQFEELQAEIYTADLEEGQRIAAERCDEHYEAIISRGGTAALIRQVVTIPVIDVSISIYDILRTIRLAKTYTENFVIVGYASITEPAHLLCDVLGYKIKIITLTDTQQADKILDTLANEHHEMILCDAITHRLALTKSLTTILITSGFESIKQAYQEAVTIANYLKKVKGEKQLLAQSIIQQKQSLVLFDSAFEVHFSTIAPTLRETILRFLRSKELANDNQYYHTSNHHVYSLTIKRLVLEEATYYSCSVKNATPPMLNNRLGLLYQKRAAVAEIVKNTLLFTGFIPETIKQELTRINPFYHTLIILGETGTAKTSIAYQAYLQQKLPTNTLISIDAALMNEKMWKFLTNPSNGPLVDTNNTLLFQNVEQLSLQDTERLITLIKNTKLTQRNKLIFTYNTDKAPEKTGYQRLAAELNSGNIYVPALKERKNELDVLTTLLLNKVTIECNQEVIGFEPKAKKEFLAFDWPGNLNQLQAAIKELVIKATGHYISHHQVTQLVKKERLIQQVSATQLPAFSLPTTTKSPTLFDYSKEIILNVLDQNEGNQTKTAQQLGISRTTLWRYLKEH